MNDKAFLLKIGEKDEKAFQLFYKKYSQIVIDRLMTLMKNDENKVFDVAQNIWLDIWNSPEKFKTSEDGNAIGFMVTYTTYQAYSYFRETKRKSAPVLIPEITEQSSSDLQYEHVSEELEMKDLNQQIDTFLDTQPELSKQIFNMCKRENLTIPEVAKKLDSTNSSVSARLSKTVKLLKEHLVEINSKHLSDLVLLSIIILKNRM